MNAALLRAARELAPGGTEVEVASIAGIPLYDGDVESERGIPEPVARLKDTIAGAAGLLLVTPEYNNSVPGVLKNAIDWLSRPPSDIKRVFGAKPVGIMGASAGNFGTVLSQAAWLPVLRTLGTDLFTGTKLLVSRSAQTFGSDGAITDDAVQRQLTQFMAGFVTFVDQRRRA